jgi:hypothetical protein
MARINLASMGAAAIIKARFASTERLRVGALTKSKVSSSSGRLPFVRQRCQELAIQLSKPGIAIVAIFPE